MQAESQPDYPLLYSVRRLPVLRPAPRRPRARRVATNPCSQFCNRQILNLSALLPRRLPARGADAQDRRDATTGFSPSPSTTSRWAAPRSTRRFWKVLTIRLLSSELPTSTPPWTASAAPARQHHIPRGLLTRAWLRFLTGARTGPESAQEDLDEAWEIAERGPMQLFLADIHLHRARLFFRETVYPWESPHADLAQARQLIEKCGYGRRKEELEDAEGGLRQQHS